MDETADLIIGLAIAVVIGIIVGIIIFCFEKIRSVLLGITFGAYVGLVLWGFITYWMTEKYILVSIIVTICFAVLGGVFGYIYDKKTIMYGTSLIGSYTFMRGWTLIFGEFVGEQQVYGLLSVSDPLVLDKRMVYYIAVFYIMFTVSAFYQFSADQVYWAMVETVKENMNEHKAMQDEADMGGLDRDRYDN